MDSVLKNVASVPDEELICALYNRMTAQGKARWVKMGIEAILTHPALFFDEPSPPRQQDDSESPPQPYKLHLQLSA